MDPIRAAIAAVAVALLCWAIGWKRLGRNERIGLAVVGLGLVIFVARL